MEVNLPIQYVMVIGFHHKKGCQVEYSFPPLPVEIDKTPWKDLPTLAIPDGAHNFESDTVYFHLPALEAPNETIFGVACYQQISADRVRNKADDVTRSTIQKSVCVLSTLPLFGHIQVKMELITAAYFREGDFSEVSILQEAFHNMNACLSATLLDTPEVFVGLSPRDLISKFRHQIIILFKLILLEKKVLFHGTSVGPLCSAVLTLVSLLPSMLEHGLKESIIEGPEASEYPEIQEMMNKSKPLFANSKSRSLLLKEDKTENLNTEGTVSFSKSLSDDNLTMEATVKISDSADLEINDSSMIRSKPVDFPDFVTAMEIKPEDAGFPLKVFQKGYCCLPYVSLHYMEHISKPHIRGFIVGATNVLFKQKKQFADVIVEVNHGSIDIVDPSLKKLLAPTTQDLRFTENLMRNINGDGNLRKSSSDLFMDGVGWEGGDEWIRSQFRFYLLCLLRTSLENEKGIWESFGESYVHALRRTYNWNDWSSFTNSEQRETPGVYLLCPGHPYDGNISMNDMKLRFTQSMQSSESGKKLNQAVERAVASTGKAFGGVFTSAKGTFSNLWSAMSSSTMISPSSSQEINNSKNASD